MNYTIVQKQNGSWELTIYAKGDQDFTTSKTFNLYISAVKAVQLLQLHMTKEDRDLLDLSVSLEDQYKKGA